MRKSFRIGLGTAVLLFGMSATVQAQNQACTGCHSQKVTDLAASSHAVLTCETCHEGAAVHAGDGAGKVKVHFDLELCGGCHTDQYGTYTYGDSWKTTYGGSPNRWSKLNDFSHYNDIIDGYGFTREYNEERSHGVMLQDHYDVTRGKYDTCMQCKSTNVAYYWDSGKERIIENETFVRGGHMTQGITIPAGTRVWMRTDRAAAYPRTHEAQVLVTLPDGTMYSSFDYPGATRNTQWTWSALYALTVNELPAGSATRQSGNGCNHCHNPHKVKRDAATGELAGFRLIRKSLLDAIDRRGLNPYASGSPRSFNGDAPLTLDEGIALCAQCHVEYVCGNSPIDGIDRDYFPWAKVSDLESIYQFQFPGYGVYSDKKYVQDWVHGTGPLSSPQAPGNGVSYLTPFPIGEELIKSQHPEAETYWESRHYGNGARCSTCHMPKVTRSGDGSQFTSHWMASPMKYMTPQPMAAFASTFGLSVSNEGIIPPCGACHGGRLSNMKSRGEKIQSDTYANALVVEGALVSSLARIKEAKDLAAMRQPVDPILLEAAAEDHRAAHVRWENLVVSENSMGFHNPTEVGSELSIAGQRAQSAQQKASAAVPAMLFPVPIPADMTIDLAGGAPGTLLIHYDATACHSSDHVLVVGDLGSFQTATSVICSIGSSGSYSLTQPSGSVWFLIGGVEGGAYSSLGQATAGERLVNGVPAVCPAITGQITTAICP
jgi:formate-dependent nitrite reductase cytochrome c552 subunit